MSNRIRGDELQHAIWKPNADIASPEVDESEGILVFTITGKEDGCIDEYGNANKEGFPALLDGEDKQGNAIHAEDMDHAYAKSIRANGKINYYVKRHSTGRLFDPTSLYSEHKQSRELHVRSEMNKWSPVDYKTFTHYLKFLSTRNAAWLRTAQRELI